MDDLMTNENKRNLYNPILGNKLIIQLADPLILGVLTIVARKIAMTYL